MSNQMAGRMFLPETFAEHPHNPGAAAHFAGSVPALHSWPVRVSPLIPQNKDPDPEHKQEECQLAWHGGWLTSGEMNGPCWSSLTPARLLSSITTSCATDQTYFYELRGIRIISGIPSTPISTPYDPKSRTLSVYSLGTTIYQRELGITMNTISQVDIHTHNRSNTD